MSLTPLFENPLPEKVEMLTVIMGMSPKEHRTGVAALLDALHECQSANSMRPIERLLWCWVDRHAES